MNLRCLRLHAFLGCVAPTLAPATTTADGAAGGKGDQAPAKPGAPEWRKKDVGPKKEPAETDAPASPNSNE